MPLGGMLVYKLAPVNAAPGAEMPRASLKSAEIAPAFETFEVDRKLPAAEQVYRGLREAIITCRLEPNEAISENRVILFMKGTPEMPACGFSARTVAALQATGAPFAAVDILPDPRIRQELSALSNWPTIPQLFVDGELVGGCDIVTELHASGELARMVAPSQGDGTTP